MSKDLSEERNAQQSKLEINVGRARPNHFAVDRAEETKEAQISFSPHDRSTTEGATRELPAQDSLATNEAITAYPPPTVKELGATNGEATSTTETGLRSSDSDEVRILTNNETGLMSSVFIKLPTC